MVQPLSATPLKDERLILVRHKQGRGGRPQWSRGAMGLPARLAASSSKRSAGIETAITSRSALEESFDGCREVDIGDESQSAIGGNVRAALECSKGLETRPSEDGE